MPLNLPLPDWVPWWGQLVVLILAILFGFAFLMMPFAVFGLKGRLDFLEAQLDDIHAELRMIATRLPDPEQPPAREPVFEQLSARPVQQREPSPTRVATPPSAPPVMPAQFDHRAQPPLRSVPLPRPVAETAPARFPADPDAVRPVPQRRPLRAEDWTPMRAGPADRETGRDRADASDWDDAPVEPPSRRPPLRATTIRATTLRDPARDSGRDRSEPTLRFPPR